jgi:hypothetical protein
MSTKLHHGYQLTVGTDPFAFIASARAALDPVRDRADAAMLAERAIDILDRAILKPEPTSDPDRFTAVTKTPLHRALSELNDEQSKLKENDWRRDPTRLELAIGRDPLTGRLGVLLFAEERLLIEAFRALPGIAEYGYWNNSDQPGGVTDAQWDERREFWDRVLPGYDPPSVAMFTWSLRGAHDTGLIRLAGDSSPLILEAVREPDTRARQIARRAVSAAACTDVTDVDRVMTLVSRSMNTTRFPEVVDAARALLVTDVDIALLRCERLPAIDDVDLKRVALRGLAAAAGQRLMGPITEDD